MAELSERDGESQPGCPWTAGNVPWPPPAKAQPLLPWPHCHPCDAGIHLLSDHPVAVGLWCWLLPDWRGAWLTPQQSRPRSSHIREELERGFLLQPDSTRNFVFQTCTWEKARSRNLVLLYNCRVNQLKRGDLCLHL